jgi:hypothetical protein
MTGYDVIVVGAGAAGLLVTRMSHQVGAIEITKQIPQGQQISAGDLTEVQVAANSGIPYVSWSDAGVITKYFAATTIPFDSLLSRNMVSATNNLVGGRNRLGLALKDGQMPSDLQVGEPVEIYSTATQANSCQAAAAAGAQAQQGGSVLTPTATVTAIGASKSGTGVTDVDVAVDPESAGVVACNASNGTVAIAITSGNG